MNWPASQPAMAPMMTNQSKPMDSLSLSFCGGLRCRRSRLDVVRHVFGEQNDFFDDGRDASEELRLHRGQPVDERLETTDVTEVIRQKVARLFAELLGDADEVLDIQPALIRFQPRQLRRRDPDAPRHFGLSARL